MRIFLNESTLDQDELEQVIALFRDQRLTMGSKCTEFETQFANQFGVKHAIMVNSGSSANLLAFFCAANPMVNDANILPAIQPHSEIIVPALTWSTSVWPIIQIGCTPVFVDSDPYTLQMKLEDVEAAITPKTKAICAPHILGNAIDLIALRKLADQYHLWLIEDTCESLGVKNNNHFAGTIGHFGTYSFYFSHHITTIEGGMIVTNDDILADLLRSMRAHGWIRHMHNAKKYSDQYPELDSRFLFVSTGFNVRPTEINAVLGMSQLKKLAAFNDKRKQIQTAWNDAFNKIQSELQTIAFTQNTDGALFGYPVLCKNSEIKKLFQQHLENHGIETRPIICGNLTRQPALQHYNYRVHGKLVGADQIMDCGLYWGIHPMMTQKQIDYVSKTVIGFFQ